MFIIFYLKILLITELSTSLETVYQTLKMIMNFWSVYVTRRIRRFGGKKGIRGDFCPSTIALYSEDFR